MPITVKNNKDGTLDNDLVETFCKKIDPHLVINRVLCLESSHSECNGRVLNMDYIKKTKKLAKKNGMRMHLDGARALNAATYLGISPAEMCKDFDTLTQCLSKGLGCPMGSLVLGTKKDIHDAIMFRKILGGGMR